MSINIDTNRRGAAWRRYRVIRIAAWERVGFLPDEANELSAAGIKIRSPLFRRLARARRSLISAIRASGITSPGEIRQYLDDLYLQREGDVWDFIREHYPPEHQRAAA